MRAIVAASNNWGIGKDNKLLFHIKEDMQRFKELTTGHVCVMGRKTFESIGRPLPKRTNIVLSRTPYVYEGVIWKENFESAVDFVKEFDEIMLIGGGELFKQYLPKADKLYLTQIQADIDGDTFFPEINWAEWNIEFEEYRQADADNPYDCRFLILQRKV